DTDTAWEQLSPLLDDAMNQLGEKDRLAVLLRFFQRKPMREVGQALGISEDAAKMRVARAVERLRGSFARRGVACPAAIIAAVLSEKTMQAAPVALVQSLGTATMMKAAGGVTVSFLIINSLKFMARLNLKSAVATGIGLLVALNVGLYVYNASHRPIPKAASSQPNRRKPPVATGGANTGQANVAQSSSSAVDPALTAALENLRAVLREPWGARRRPDQKIRDALARFGPNRKAAVPVLMEALEQRDLGLQVSAAFGLQELGTDAAVALPELMALLRANRLAVLNDGFESLFAAINPGPNWISDLIDAIRQPNLMGRGRVANLIATLIQKNPGSETIYRPAVMALLQDPDPDARFYAAQALGKIPGAKETSAVPELISALKADALQDPHHYDPVFDPESSTTYIRKWEQQQDDMRRFEAVFGLESFGSDAKNAVPVLEEVANNTTNTELHALALEAIGTIDPEKRKATPEIDELLTAKEKKFASARRASKNYSKD
ncbi:MAG: hypothetical protein DME18_16060, partial [Verrucomicrobia bacterium]